MIWKALSDGAGSRRRVLQMASATLVSTPLLALLPRSAAGGAKKRCKKKHGKYLPGGECRCTVTWRKGQQAPHKFRCENTDGCGCYQTVDGSGFCAMWDMIDSHHGCESDAECDPDDACTVLPGYSSGASCEDKTTCGNAQFGCINGTCQYTSCRPPCS
jgi:hypothetical protein